MPTFDFLELTVHLFGTSGSLVLLIDSSTSLLELLERLLMQFRKLDLETGNETAAFLWLSLIHI